MSPFGLAAKFIRRTGLFHLHAGVQPADFDRRERDEVARRSRSTAPQSAVPGPEVARVAVGEPVILLTSPLHPC